MIDGLSPADTAHWYGQREAQLVLAKLSKTFHYSAFLVAIFLFKHTATDQAPASQPARQTEIKRH